MCRVEECERHEFNKGLCLPHYKEAIAPVEEKPKRKSRKKKVDNEEVITTDATEVVEERNDIDE